MTCRGEGITLRDYSYHYGIRFRTPDTRLFLTGDTRRRKKRLHNKLLKRDRSLREGQAFLLKAVQKQIEDGLVKECLGWRDVI